MDAGSLGQRERLKRPESALAKDGINVADHEAIITSVGRQGLIGVYMHGRIDWSLLGDLIGESYQLIALKGRKTRKTNQPRRPGSRSANKGQRL